MAENILTIREYFGNGKKTFVIPNYQRGFKWGVPDKNHDNPDAVNFLMTNLVDAYEKDLKEYFIQGVTVHHDKDETKITLVDGQQRTTVFYLLLKYLNVKNINGIEYAEREKSNDFFDQLNNNIDKISEIFPVEKEEFQDIFYFKKAIQTIHTKIGEQKSNEKENFKNFILNKVKLFYIKIDQKKATKTFRMMNGNKAIMKSEELIKSALLSKISNHEKNENIANNDVNNLLQIIKKKVGEEWETNTLRSKYAREWDKWLYWWNRKDVKAYFNSGNTPLGLLLKYYFEIENDKNNREGKKYDFKSFNELFFDKNKDTKKSFKGIRDLQKKFEDLYNDVESYNYMGLIMKGNSGSKEKALKYFLKDSIEPRISIKKYAKWNLLGINQAAIIGGNEEINKQQKAHEVLQSLTAKIVYDSYNEEAFKQLLRMNVILDNQLGRKFDFTIYDNRSLEHIHPQSLEDEIKFDTEDKYSIHCIGNLVLIKGNDNSSFSNKPFIKKKEIYFNTHQDKNPIKWSLKLLHSVAIFSQKEWNKESIIKNQQLFIQSFNQYYNLENNEK